VQMNGILLVDKPEGITSNGVVQIIKRLVRPSKVGHSGTLDPAASGLITIAVGAATRALEFLDESKKTYVLNIKLGEETDTCDREGTVLSQADPSAIDSERIEDILGRFRGIVRQIPPHFSAIKLRGVPLYKLARKGLFPKLQERTVEIYSLEILSWAVPILSIRMVCSRGTYARSLARDVGRDLGVGGRLQSLRRITSGPFCIEQALPLDELVRRGADSVSDHLIALIDVLQHVPSLHLSQDDMNRLGQGICLVFALEKALEYGIEDCGSAHIFKTVSPNGDVLIFVQGEEREGAVRLQPRKVLRLEK